MVLNSSDDKRRGRLFRYAPVFLWIGVIFFLSSPMGAAEETSRIIGPLLNFFFPGMTEETRGLIHAYVRKSAHFTEYAVLAFLVVRGLVRSSVNVQRDWRFLFAILTVATVASLDEFNQSFEPSRTSSLWDVLLDCSGGIAMLGFLWLIKRPSFLPKPARE